MKTKNENDTTANHDDIARLAQQIWEREGRQSGRDLEYWLRAECQMLSNSPRAGNLPQKPSTKGMAPSQGARKAIRLPESVSQLVYTE
jgi:hypothetical protein